MKTVIEMARESGLIGLHEPSEKWIKEFSHFAELVRADLYKEMNDPLVLMCKKMVADEREACARIADSMDSLQDGAIAFVIRARGNT